MANTDLFVSVRFEGRGLGLPDFKTKSMSIDLTGTDHCVVTQDIGTTAQGELVNIPASMTTLGPARFENKADPVTEPTKILQLGIRVAGTFYSSIAINPGEAWTCRLDMAPNALYAKGATGTTKLVLAVAEK